MKDYSTILLVDDTEANIDMLVSMLKEYDLIPSTSGADALDIVENEDIDLILLDIMMPEMDGFEVCQALKRNEKTKNIPVVFITAKSDEESIERAYDVGGADYVTKPFKAKELLARVRTQLNLRKTMQDLEFLASRDVMTGLYNRRKFFELALGIFNDSNENLFASMVDIDKFKNINDNFGHQSGDIVIKSMAKKISELIPTNWLLARVGGEEFVILGIENSRKNAMQILENIRDAIEKLETIDNEKIIKFTISGGVSYKNENTKTLDELLKNADIALYEAKNSGRNKIIFG